MLTRGLDMLRSAWDFIAPPEGIPDGTRAYHFRMGLVSTMSFIGVTILFFALIAQVPFVGQIARAQDMKQEREAAIATAVKPLQEQITAIALNQTQTQEILREIRIDQLGAKLRDLQLLKCKLKQDESQDRVADEILATQRQYKELTGDRYELEPCH